MHSSTQLTASAHEQPSLSGLTGTDALFDTLVDSIASQIGSAVPGVSANELRTRLLAFRPRFEAIYQGVLQEHLGTDLARLTKELREPKVRAYFDARRRMAPELGRLLQELCVQMGETRV